MKKAICTTTINEPTTALLKFIEIAQRDDWTIFIVGDQKTPHESYLKLAQQYPFVAYITPQKQESKYKALSDLIGWNCIQRRNFGMIEAYNWGADIIAVVDDDNIPYDNWGQMLAIANEPLAAVHQSPGIVWDPLAATNYPDLWHRGYPIQLLPIKNRSTLLGMFKRPRVLVQAGLWDGEPDVDAVCRIARGPFDLKYDTQDWFCGTKPGPFNSQNTILHRDCFPTYFLFPHIGRMDDIWASYVLQRAFPDSVVYGPASVYQERNDHDLSRDLDAELNGYKNTLKLVQELYKPEPIEVLDVILKNYLPEQSFSAYEAYKACFKQKPHEAS